MSSTSSCCGRGRKGITLPSRTAVGVSFPSATICANLSYRAFARIGIVIYYLRLPLISLIAFLDYPRVFGRSRLWICKIRSRRRPVGKSASTSRPFSPPSNAFAIAVSALIRPKLRFESYGTMVTKALSSSASTKQYHTESPTSTQDDGFFSSRDCVRHLSCDAHFPLCPAGRRR